MGWIGKVVGGTFGFAMGGPLGAVVGAAFGHAYDAVDNLEEVHHTRLSYNEQAQATFFVAVFSMLAKLTKADGYVSKEEIDSIQRIMLEDLRLTPGSRQVAINIFQSALDSSDTFDRFAVQFYNAFSHQPQMLALMIDILMRVSVADGKITPNEENLILSAVQIFRLSDTEFQRIRSRYIQDVDKYYSTLECQPTDSDDTIKSQYRKLVREFHPDAIASKGLPEAFTKFAEDKFRDIQEAYDAIKQQRGFK